MSRLHAVVKLELPRPARELPLVLTERCARRPVPASVTSERASAFIHRAARRVHASPRAVARPPGVHRRRRRARARTHPPPARAPSRTRRTPRSRTASSIATACRIVHRNRSSRERRARECGASVRRARVESMPRATPARRAERASSERARGTSATTSGTPSAALMGRLELVSWLNRALRADYAAVSECADGVAYCQLLDALHPGSVPLHRLDFNARSGADNERNVRVLERAMRGVGLAVDVDFEALASGTFSVRTRRDDARGTDVDDGRDFVRVGGGASSAREGWEGAGRGGGTRASVTNRTRARASGLTTRERARFVET